MKSARIRDSDDTNITSLSVEEKQDDLPQNLHESDLTNSKEETQMEHNKTLSTFVYLVWCVGFSIFIGCGDTEDTDSIVIPDELYDTSELTYDEVILSKT